MRTPTRFLAIAGALPMALAAAPASTLDVREAWVGGLR